MVLSTGLWSQKDHSPIYAEVGPAYSFIAIADSRFAEAHLLGAQALIHFDKEPGEFSSFIGTNLSASYYELGGIQKGMAASAIVGFMDNGLGFAGRASISTSSVSSISGQLHMRPFDYENTDLYIFMEVGAARNTNRPESPTAFIGVGIVYGWKL